MRELTADLFISLDGFGSGVDEAAYFGYFGSDLGNWVREHLEARQVIVMGRVTYEALARLSASATDEVSARMSALPKVVCSCTLQEPLAWKNTRLVKGAIADEIKATKTARRRPSAVHRQHTSGEELDEGRTHRPPSAHDLSVDTRRCWEGADLCRLPTAAP